MGESFVLPRVASLDDPLRIAVLISGGGSGLEALLRFQTDEQRCHRTVIVLSDREDAGGIVHGSTQGIPSKGIPIPKTLPASERRIEHERLIQDELESSGAELVVLSGYMRILTPWFVGMWKGRLVNIHPSLLPDFPGPRPHRDVLSAGISTTGCTVHLVDEGVDSGPILAQRTVPIFPDDDEKSLQERVKKAEHVLYPEVLELLCSGGVSL
ncbi:MAG: phosphoribosylglycinamide formyltransferase [Euryarchaeota archaeon]|nr:phosphoribosylglycinamide formyltransferase [Euryarchaeota archaeon]|tara:strand:- start:2081 stop:2716 length:636 start_codon:yes stop_codon:yes gene_type:complete